MTINYSLDDRKLVNELGRPRARSFTSLAAIFGDQRQLTIGQDIPVAIRWVSKLHDQWQPVDAPTRTATLSLDTTPNKPIIQAGVLTVGFEGETSPFVLLAQPTHTICYLQAVLNDLSTIAAAGGIEIVPSTAQGGNLETLHRQRIGEGPFTIRFNEAGARTDITFALTSQTPSSGAFTVATLTPGDATTNHEFQVTPSSAYQLAAATLDTASTDPTAVITEMTAGGPITKAVHRLTITPDPIPQDRFRIVSGANSSRGLSSDATGEDLSAALNALYGTTDIVANHRDHGIWEWTYSAFGAQALPTVELDAKPSATMSGTLAWTNAHPANQSAIQDGLLTLTIKDGATDTDTITTRITLNQPASA